MDKCLFSTYGVCIEHPVSWRIFIDPKAGFNRDAGFIRFEDYVKRHGAQLSLSINWQSAASDALSFAQNYCQRIEEQYARQFKRKELPLRRKKSGAAGGAPKARNNSIEEKEVIAFRGSPAAWVVSEYAASLGLVRSPKDKAVRILQLAFYDEASGRAVVSSVMGLPAQIRGQEAFLKELVLSARCIPEIKDPVPAYPFPAPPGGLAAPNAAAVNL